MTGPKLVPRLGRRSGVGHSGATDYIVRDEFVTALAAGAVDGTDCEPGPGDRTVVDTEDKLSPTLIKGIFNL